MEVEEDQEQQPQEEEKEENYSKMLGLYYMSNQANAKFNKICVFLIFICNMIFISYLLLNENTSSWSYSITQFINMIFSIISIRCWWIYYCKEQDSVCAISMKIVISTLSLLLILALSFICIILLHWLDSETSGEVSLILYFVSYLIMIASILINL